MLYEYAVEPAAMGSDWQNFRYLIDLLSFERGRLISRFPNKWEQEVIAAADASGMGQVKRASLVDRLKRARERGSIVRFGRHYDPTLGDWLVNALAQHQQRPFQAIIADANLSRENAVVVVDNVVDTHALIRSTHSWEISRTGQAIADAVAPLVCAAKEILIVDPFIDWRDIRGNVYVEPLREILARLAVRGKTGVVCQLHYRTHDSRPPAKLIKTNAKKWLNGLLPAGYKLELYEWSERVNGEDFHDRHILCDCGGLSLGAGIQAVGAHQNVRITLEPHELVQTLKSRFTIGTSAFDLVGKILVVSSDGTVVER